MKGAWTVFHTAKDQIVMTFIMSKARREAHYSAEPCFQHTEAFHMYILHGHKIFRSFKNSFGQSFTQNCTTYVLPE